MKSKINGTQINYYFICKTKLWLFSHNIQLEHEGQPGLESITKQYMYGLAFGEFIDYHGFKNVKNAFLFPTYDDNLENKGRVKLDILSDQDCGDIGVIMIPAGKLNKMYLNNNNKFFGIKDLIDIL